MSIKSKLAMTWFGFRQVTNNIGAMQDGQDTNYAILQTAHRLEKGLCIRDPRAGWGFEKAGQLVDLIAKEKRKDEPDQLAVLIGESVLSAYVDAKRKTGCKEDADGLAALEEKIAGSGIGSGQETAGGALLLSKKDMCDISTVEDLFVTRHSVRDFADTPVDREKLEKAVRLALRAPSACNRQATQIYVISGEDRIRAGSNNEYHADKYLIITGNMRAFNTAELNDWIVSTSIFCGYLSLALHAEGIGSCVFRKETIRKSRYNDAIRKMCRIPDDEQIILEMAIGNYRDEFKVPVSYRREAQDIIHYI